MSTTFSMVCHKCKETLWVGQTMYIYGTPEALKDHATFLHKHLGHPLEFACDDDCQIPSDYKEMTPLEQHRAQNLLRSSTVEQPAAMVTTGDAGSTPAAVVLPENVHGAPGPFDAKDCCGCLGKGWIANGKHASLNCPVCEGTGKSRSSK